MGTTSSSGNRNRRLETVDLIYIALAVSLIAICSWIQIPASVPFTLQTFAVFLIVDLLGGFRGTISVFVYILLGAIGMPVFASFRGGPSALLGPTGGYVIGFLFTALIMWIMEPLAKKALWLRALSMFVGLNVCYVFGTIWFKKVFISDSGNHLELMAVLGLCVFPFIIPDLLKISLALAIGSHKGLRRIVRR